MKKMIKTMMGILTAKVAANWFGGSTLLSGGQAAISAAVGNLEVMLVQLLPKQMNVGVRIAAGILLHGMRKQPKVGTAIPRGLYRQCGRAAGTRRPDCLRAVALWNCSTPLLPSRDACPGVATESAAVLVRND